MTAQTAGCVSFLDTEEFAYIGGMQLSSNPFGLKLALAGFPKQGPSQSVEGDIDGREVITSERRPATLCPWSGPHCLSGRPRKYIDVI